MDKQFQVKLIVRRVKALAPLQWLRQSWQIFTQAPLVLLLMFLTLIVNAILGSVHEILNIASLFISPFLTAGIYRSVVMLQQQTAITYTDLFKPMQEVDCRMVFIRLAALNLILALPLATLFNEVHKQQQAGVVNSSLVLVLVISTLLVWMIFAYAVAIAYFLKERRLVAIMQASFIACWRNITPLVVFAVLSLLLILLTIPTMFFGLILVIPILNIAFFLSFNEFFALQVKATDDGVLEV